jgi:hypothetical protein
LTWQAQFNGDGFDGPQWAGVVAVAFAVVGVVVSIVGLITSFSPPRRALTVLAWASVNAVSGLVCLALVPYAYIAAVTS